MFDPFVITHIKNYEIHNFIYNIKTNQRIFYMYFNQLTIEFF